jgi:hypothetical protein
MRLVDSRWNRLSPDLIIIYEKLEQLGLANYFEGYNKCRISATSASIAILSLVVSTILCGFSMTK